MSDRTLTTSCYIVLEPTFRGNKVATCKVAKVTQSRPGVAEASGILVRLDVVVPESAFDPIIARLNVPDADHEVLIKTIPTEAPDA